MRTTKQGLPERKTNMETEPEKRVPIDRILKLLQEIKALAHKE